ncbi:MAG TPA: hypothetical protein VFW92_08945, partial [Candidatus Limnocylindrales bacterium]|nr:hypothetical protein [Candidatus Limnocylindrales bacterium]
MSDEELGRSLAALLRARATSVTTTRDEAAARARAARLAAATGRGRIVRRAVVLGLAAVLAVAGLGAAFLLARPPRPNPQPTPSLQADRSTTPSPSTAPSFTPPPSLAPSPTPEPTPDQLTATFHLRPVAPASTDIAFGDALHGWAVGDGTILATRDGGATWGRVWQGTAQVMEVQAIGPTTAWALAQPPPSGGAGPVGLDTDILLTLGDQGRTWRTIQLRSPLIDLQLVGDEEAWALSLASEAPAAPQQLLHTTDGGLTWRQALPGPIRAVCFADAQRGWAIGSMVQRTTDGGAHWVSLGGHPPVAADQALQLTCTRGALWLLGGTDSGPFDYVLRRSTDGGATWTAVLASPADAPSAGVATGPADIGPFAAADASTALIAGTTEDGPGMTASVTRDGGRTWTATTLDLPPMAPTAATALDGTHLWLGTGLLAGGGGDTYGLLLASQDGGQTWQQRWPAAGPRPLESLAFVSAVSGFGLGTLNDPRAVVRTVDGGRTWQLVGRLSRAPLASQAEPAGAGPSGAQSVGPSFGFVDLQDGWALDGTGLER